MPPWLACHVREARYHSGITDSPAGAGRTQHRADPATTQTNPPGPRRRAPNHAPRRIRWDKIGRVLLLVVLAVVFGLYVQQGLGLLSVHSQADQQRAIVAILVLVYAAMRAATALRSFYFFQKIERLEVEARRLAALTEDGPAASAQRKQVVSDVGGLRRTGEMNAYIDLLFLSLVMVLCISKIVTS